MHAAFIPLVWHGTIAALVLSHPYLLTLPRVSFKETEGTVPVEFRAFGDGGELLASESVVSRADAPAMSVPVSEEG